MHPQLSRGWFQVAFFLTFTSAILLFFVTPGTAEFNVTILTLLMGLGFMTLIIVIVKFFSK